MKLVDIHTNTGIKPAELAKKHNIPGSTLRDWIQKYGNPKKKNTLKPSTTAPTLTSTPESYTQNLVRNCLTPPMDISFISGVMDDSEVIINDKKQIEIISVDNMATERSTMNLSVDSTYELEEN